MKKQNLVFFDLDNTILNLDSSYVFIRKYYNPHILLLSVLRKFRIIEKSTFYSEITRHCDKTLVNEKLDLFVAELTRYGISDRAGAALWNGAVKTLEDNEVLMKEDETSITENFSEFINDFVTRCSLNSNH